MLKINAGVLPASLLPRIGSLAWIYIAVYSIIDITVALFLIYLFSRVKIKEEFR